MKWFIFFFALLPVLPVQAAEPLKVTYGLYAGGFNVVDIDGTYTLTDDRYKMEMDLKTAGLLGKLAPWSGVLQTNGLQKGIDSTPLSHSFANTWRGETETSQFDFNKNGLLTAYDKIHHDGTVQNKMPPHEVFDGGAVDMLTALFRSMNNGSCETTEPVLDGKRRFDMVFTSQGSDTIQKSRYTIFDGEAEICEIEIKPVAGKWRDKPRGWMSIQDQAKNNGQLPRLWFAKLRDDIPPIPVRFQIKTNYGTMIMHLTDVK